MPWITKDLTLDVLAIIIHSLGKISERIEQETPAGEWPPAEAPTSQAEVEQSTAQEAAPEPQVNEEELRTQAQTALRTIAQHGDTEWITNTLFPQFGVQTLTDVPVEKLPELITKAHEHKGAA